MAAARAGSRLAGAPDAPGGQEDGARVAVAEPTLRPTRPRPGGRTLLSVLLVVAVVASLLGVDLSGGVLTRGGLTAVSDLLASLLRPELTAELLLGTIPSATLLTVSYAVAGLSVALAIGLPGAIVVSGTLARRRATRLTLIGASRAVFATLRAPHELVWALLFLQVLGPHPLAGILGIGVPYGAVIARVLGERLQDVPQGPVAALRSAGASPLQVLAYGRLPAAANDMVGYVMYRFECAVRAAVVLTFVGLGGIGQEIENSLADLRFERVWPLLAALVLVIVAIDLLSARLRDRLVV